MTTTMQTLRTILLLSALLMMTAFGCEETETEPQFTVGREMSVRMNQLYTSSDGEHTLKITSVSDSRCPEGAVCVWAGEITIIGEFTDSGQILPFEIHSLLTDRNQQPEGFTVRIIDALPHPKTGVETKPEELVIVLLIEKN